MLCTHVGLQDCGLPGFQTIHTLPVGSLVLPFSNPKEGIVPTLNMT